MGCIKLEASVGWSAHGNEEPADEDAEDDRAEEIFQAIEVSEWHGRILGDIVGPGYVPKAV
jgi:hypothetical protein